MRRIGSPCRSGAPVSLTIEEAIMALFFADLVREASWGTGTADLPLGGALPGHRAFADAVPPGVRFHYAIAGVTHPGEWETGEGEIGSGGTLVRMPAASSSGGGIVDFGPGLKTVALTVNADWYEARERGVAAITGGTISGVATLQATGPIQANSGLALGAMLNLYTTDYGLGIQPGTLYLRANGGFSFYAGGFHSDAAEDAGGSGTQLARLTASGLSIAGSYRIGGAQVVGARRSGWGSPTGTATRTAFDTASVTTAQLAQRVKALIDDLAAHGLIGA